MKTKTIEQIERLVEEQKMMNPDGTPQFYNMMFLDQDVIEELRKKYDLIEELETEDGKKHIKVSIYDKGSSQFEEHRNLLRERFNNRRTRGI